jgi:ADP-ribose pyrophosphatase
LSSQGFTKLEEHELFRGHAVWMSEAEFRGPDGSTFLRDIVHHPGAVSVVPLLDDGRVVMVRQYRSALETEILEIPAGKRDVEGEPPELTAKRELAEEVGLDSDHLELLAEFYNSPGFCDEHSYTYLATALREVERAPVDAEESAMEIVHIALDDVPLLIARGELVDAKSIIGLLLARERLTAR